MYKRQLLDHASFSLQEGEKVGVIEMCIRDRCGKTDKAPIFEKKQTVSTTSDDVDRLHDAASGMCISEDGHYLFTSTAGDNTVAMRCV